MGEAEFGCKKGAEAVLRVPPNSSVPISYHPLFGPHEDLLLLELDEKLLPDVINQRVSLRGQPDEDAVFCTQSKTYAIKFVGTSNSVFLVPPADQYTVNDNPEDCNENASGSDAPHASVLKLAPGTMELVEVAPKIDKLKSLISENPYKFDEDCEMYDTGLYQWDDLTDRVQASDEELRSALRTLSAVEINGYWRIVDEKYMDQILNTLINNSLINEWSLSALIEEEVVESLVNDGFSSVIAHHCLEVYGCKRDGSEEGGNNVWELDTRRVCVHFARRILGGGKMKIESFMEEWSEKVPRGVMVSVDMLEGEVLIEKLGIQSWVYAFSVSSLPSDPANRFSRLFLERPKWDWKDLHPYIRDLSVPGLTSDGLLLKYTRRTQPTADAEPVFTAR
uniref:sister chromatid cohesion protein DCC1 n=1 Tax=Erigeron canadensis TaxID=72917 RepID=UPI001CB91DC5|nr:sister chromatid cohesion protein DCC1 [Erigeron canadensis]